MLDDKLFCLEVKWVFVEQKTRCEVDMICHCSKSFIVCYIGKGLAILFSLGSWVEELKLLLPLLHTPTLKPTEELGKRASLPISKFGFVYNFIGHNRSLTDPKKGTMSTCMYGSSAVAFS
jgi:hypothetical protein